MLGFTGYQQSVPDSPSSRDFFNRWRLPISFTSGRETPFSWIAPPWAWTTINCDGSIRSSATGYGTISHNHLSQAIFAIVGGTSDISILRMELLAIKVGLHKAISLGLDQIQCQSDSLMVINIINGHMKSPWPVMDILHIIWDLRDSFRRIVFQFHIRESNFCADFLAGFAYTNQELHLCISSVPNLLPDLLHKDAVGHRYFRL
ncbi:uncharacterized protein LOC122645426 [Telopea speciosissima]|uniref:uncharacterized protein LOC122645426 n=1 Tax=Telopea speciosissima TaxID=54955 RepID=UPI001CC4387D|nr:uncharacterized protein LOC122645426 [Telopea speciosissima]